MKKKYRSPLVKMVDFTYDDQVTATSGDEGYLGMMGSKHSPEYCQHWTKKCEKYFYIPGSVPCMKEPSDEADWSLRRLM